MAYSLQASIRSFRAVGAQRDEYFRLSRPSPALSSSHHPVQSLVSATTLGLVEVWETEAQAVDAYTNPRLIEMALAHREALSGVRLAAAVAPVSSTAGVTPTSHLTKATEPKNFGLLALSYEAEEPKNSDLEELED